jgi:hypothetical protein
MPDSLKPEEVIPDADAARDRGNNLAQKALTYFQQHEGKLETWTEATHSLQDYFDEDVSESEANSAVQALVEDLVDPVQNVSHPDSYHVGIIEYREWSGDGCYGYVQFHDVAGKRKRVVCAKCVDEFSHDHNVTHATAGESSFSNKPDAGWEELRDDIVEHIEEEHDVAPEEITVGANLESSTTMNSNQAWHDGNTSGGTNIDISNRTVGISPQGSGSGLNADKVDGNDKSDL